MATHRIAVAPDGTPAIVQPDGSALAVPIEFRSLLQFAYQGHSLAQMAQWLRAQPIDMGRFRLLSKFLSFLYKQGLLMDPKVAELAEALQSDFTWRDSIAFEDLFSIDLFKFERRSILSSGAVQGAFLFAASFLGLIGFLFFMTQFFSFDWLKESPDRSVWMFVVAWISVFTLGRSIRAIFQSFSMHLLTTFGPTLRLKCDLFLLSIACDDASRARSRNDLYVIATFACLMSLAIPCALFKIPVVASFAADIVPLVSFFTLILFLCELSPFRQSALTEALRSFYIYLDQNREGSKDASIEQRLQRIHIFMCSLWVVCLGLFLAIPFRFFALALKNSVSLSANSERAGALVLGLLSVALVLSFIDDIVNGIAEGGGDLLSVRRLWKRRQALGTSIAESRRPSQAELEKLPLIRQLDPNLREILLDADHAQVFEIAAGKTLCHQGDRDRTLYVVLAGRLGVYKRASSGLKRVIAFLSPGAILGEVAFFFGGQRTATVIAAENSRILAIRHDERISDLDQGKSKELQLRIWFLQALSGGSFLKDIPADALDALIFAGERFEARAGQKVINEGERGDACYFMIQGQANVTQNFKIVGRLRTGEAFGEIALLRPELLRTATITADTDLLAVRIDGEKFWSLLSTHLPLALEIEKLAEHRLQMDIRR